MTHTDVFEPSGNRHNATDKNRSTYVAHILDRLSPLELAGKERICGNQETFSSAVPVEQGNGTPASSSAILTLGIRVGMNHYDIVFIGQIGMGRIIPFEGPSFVENLGGPVSFAAIAASCTEKRIVAATRISESEGSPG
jgi:hypothetical protein